MANYNVVITNGNGSQRMQKGTYSVSAVVEGYDASTLDPKAFTVASDALTQVFTLAGTGTLTFNVNETGAAGGTPVTGGTIVMTDSTGNIEYGSPVTINATGEAVFNNVPYSETGNSVVLYFKQLTTDDNHNIYDGIIEVTMTEANQTEYIQNTLAGLQSFELKDATYGFPLSGTLTFTNNA